MKCGYVAVLGRPNAGKSSLINRLVGEEVAIVTKRQQTTRNNILGIVTNKAYQIIFIDTPGIHHRKNKLDKYMMKNVRLAIGSCDVAIYLIDASREVDDEELDYIKMLKDKAEKLLVVLNKVDKKLVANVDADLKISVQENINIDKLVEEIVKLLPEREMMYDEDAFTDKSINFLICEHIRGLLLEKLDNEIPHGVAVVVDKVKELSNKVFIDISIIVEKERHKGFIIGKNGLFIKDVGISAREYAETLFRKQVVLHLFVKVDENWRSNNIDKYGY